ncbi:NADH dehydrogenase [ubiquinone] 1 alpha subcomplex subunit 6-like [Cylas formicarius]|uniref:NADH dehydrogenase [ubiquinone] 1 alpha subcomplex subunit 6-like n=1 Tax=Cylas formicarius TaxID=197179 RepID=UPI00295868AC|nr:NADH dehydrogenase [ubiquinone] 1 alpha subcomplex subunit 6-like [Cylas formicarius]
MTSEASRRVLKKAKTILSLDRRETRRHVISLYKSWSRQIPYIVQHYDLPFMEKVYRQKLREEFTKHKCIDDIRIIDMLVIKSHMDLKEIIENWSPKKVLAQHMKEWFEPKPKNFVSRFLQGKD